MTSPFGVAWRSLFSMADQVPFGTDNFAENPEPRCPSVLILDVSASMKGEPIAELNAGLQVYRDELAADPLAAKRVEVAVVSFGGQVELASDFAPRPPSSRRPRRRAATRRWAPRSPTGSTSSPSARSRSRANGIAFYRPWIFLVTDGDPTDEWRTAAGRVRDGEANKSFAFFSVGVQGARMDVLQDSRPASRCTSTACVSAICSSGCPTRSSRCRTRRRARKCRSRTPPPRGAGPRSDPCGVISPVGARRLARPLRRAVPGFRRRRRPSR